MRRSGPGGDVELDDEGLDEAVEETFPGWVRDAPAQINVVTVRPSYHRTRSCVNRSRRYLYRFARDSSERLPPDGANNLTTPYVRSRTRGFSRGSPLAASP